MSWFSQNAPPASNGGTPSNAPTPWWDRLGQQLPTEPFNGGVSGQGAPGAPPATFDNQSTASDPTAAKWKIGQPVPPGYETFHPNGDQSQLGIRRTASSGPPTPTGPIKIGDQTTFNGQSYTWDGKTWTGGANGATSGGTYGGDPTDVDGWLKWMATQPGHDPILDTPQGQAYYKQRITETGGLNAQNTAYWQNKGTLAANGGAVGAPEGGSSGGPGGFGSGWNTLPTADQLKANPGFQYAIDEAQRGMQSSAAAHGTLLNGRTNQAMDQNLANYALGNFYLPLANLGLNYNQANQDNLYRWGQLGLNGSSYGATGKPA